MKEIGKKTFALPVLLIKMIIRTTCP